MESLLQDLRHTLRSLLRAPRLSATVVVTLALGIGVVTAFFSLLNALLLRPLPYGEPEELVRVQERGMRMFGVSGDTYRALRSGAARSLEGVAAYTSTRFNLGTGEWTESVRGARVTPELLQLLGVRPASGRLPGADDAYRGSETVVVIGHDLWVRRFDGDPGAVGSSLLLDGEPVRLVGVMPPGFVFPERGEAWAPVVRPEEEFLAAESGVPVVARLRGGVGYERAATEVEQVGRRLAAEGVISGGGSLSLWEGVFVRSRGFGPMPWIFLVASGFVLLIVCSNVASLLLARAARRRSSYAVRSALGASRVRIVRETLVEGGVLAALGGLLGLLVSVLILRVFLSALGANFPLWFDPALDPAVVFFTAVAAAVSVLAFALPPALQASGVDPAEHLGGGMGVAGGRRGRRLRRSLIVGEIALAFVLVVGGALTATGVARMAAVDTGVDGDEVYEVWVSLRGAEAESESARRTFFARTRERLEAALPGTSTAVVGGFTGFLGGDTAVSADSVRRMPLVTESGVSVNPRDARLMAVTPGYFETVGLELRAGRGFEDGDAVGSPRVAVVSEAVAERLWPDGSPVGGTLRMGDGAGVTARVVGVVEAHRTVGGGAADGMRAVPQRFVYLAEAQTEAGGRRLVARPPAGSAERLGPTVRGEVRAFAPGQVVSAVRRIDATRDSLADAFGAIAALLLSLAFAGAALACMGIFGLIAQNVAERTREIGVRAALGGTTSKIVRSILGDGMQMTVLGLALGLALVLLLGRALEVILFEVDPRDPVILGGMTVAFVLVGWVASLVPARRAAGVDPVQALRSE